MLLDLIFPHKSPLQKQFYFTSLFFLKKCLLYTRQCWSY